MDTREKLGEPTSCSESESSDSTSVLAFFAAGGVEASRLATWEAVNHPPGLSRLIGGMHRVGRIRRETESFSYRDHCWQQVSRERVIGGGESPQKPYQIRHLAKVCKMNGETALKKGSWLV